MESSSIPTPGNASTEKQVAIALRVEHSEHVIQHKNRIIQRKNRIMKYQELIIQCNESIVQCKERIIQCLELDIQCNKIRTELNEIKNEKKDEKNDEKKNEKKDEKKDEIKDEIRVLKLEASLDTTQKAVSIMKAALVSAQARVKTLLEKKQGILDKCAILSKEISELEAAEISHRVAEQSDGAATAEI
ncbi:hypothetical protein SLS63_004413 [Diaporthe eres]|uniref:Uncharacterized protein n=1 Tax=Diaporthe eres TaxID=83184 RepID=A0ABR1PDY7_DIAER